MKKSIHLLFSFLLIASFCNAQIYTLDFDANNAGYTSGPDGFDNGTATSDYYDIGATGFSGTYNSSTGNFFAAQDIDNVMGFTSSTQVFEINGIDITNFTNLTFALDIAEDEASNGAEDWDDADIFHIEYRVDGGSFNTLIEIGSAGGTNQTADILNSSNAALIGTVITDEFTNFSGPISNTGATLDIKITITLNSGDEDIAFDNLVINGDNTSGTPGILLTSPAGSTSESGTTTTFTAVLNTEPTSNVVLDIASGDTGENTVSPTMLTFTTSDWDMPQTITVTGIDDAIFDGDQTTTITVSSNNGMTTDTDYQNLQETVDVINVDDEAITNNDVRINEADVDQDGTDFAEFIELFGTPNLSLDGLVIVLYNGSNNLSYETYDLDGFNLDANGFFLIGATGVTGASGLVPFTPEIEIKSTGLQNGPDAITLFTGNDSDFPDGTAVTTANLIDALVYDTNDGDDPELAVLYSDPTIFDVDEMIQVNEDEFSNSEGQTIQRGSWFVSAPTPRSMNVLPVKLTQLNVRPNGKSNLISWTTAIEINNEKFEIEHSSNGKDFENIGTVVGHGNSYREIDYTFEDETPLSGTNYYRLRQVDFDGAYEYTRILKIENSKFGINIYPFSTSTFVNVTISEIESAKVYISNSAGTIALRDVVTEGLNIIDVTRLTSGLHFITIVSNGEIETHKFFKQ